MEEIVAPRPRRKEHRVCSSGCPEELQINVDLGDVVRGGAARLEIRKPSRLDTQRDSSSMPEASRPKCAGRSLARNGSKSGHVDRIAGDLMRSSA